ncbi:MAG: Gldg family protein [Lachnospiraceae bacterium]|nr:Gldg family protein [Lachnospiraceae bacterium]
MKAIYKRELKAYFQSFTGWLFCAATLFVISLYFTSYNLGGGYAYIAYALSAAAFIFIILIPILTMRILAEERRQKTDQLILTAPISVWKVVVGKYLAMLTVYMIPILIVCTYPIIMSFFGTVSLSESYAAIFGFVLYGCAGIALGLFISGITESQVISAVLSLIAMFLTYMMSGVSNLISAQGNILTKILNCADFGSRITSFYDGTISVTGVVYFVSVSGLLLFFATQTIQKRRYTVSTKKLKAGAYSSTMIVIITAAAVFVNLMANELPESLQTIDVTSNKLYSITEDTKNFLSTLDEDITIYVLASESNHDTNVEKTLKKYMENSSHIKMEYKDPSVYPGFASSYSDSTLSTGSLIIEGSKRSRAINYNDLYETEYDYYTYSSTTTGYDCEGQVTSALAYVTSNNNAKIYELTGHGETEVPESFMNTLAKANVESESLNLISAEGVPEDAQAVIVMAPQKDFTQEEADKLKEYLRKGGNMLLNLGWTEAEMNNLSSVLADYGLTVGRDVIVETSQSGYTQNPFYLLPTIESTEITSSLSGNYYIFMPYCITLGQDSTNETANITPLLTTSSYSYGKADIQNAQSYDKEEGDSDGPFNVGVMSEITVDTSAASEVKTTTDAEPTDNGAGDAEEGTTKTSKMIVYASDSVFTEQADNMVAGSNSQLFRNSLNSMITVDTSISIPVKDYDMNTLTVPALQNAIIGIVTTILVPLILLITGIVITVRRRKK